MQAFASRNEEALKASSENAKRFIGAWETTLALRIASQKAVDLANRLPAVEHQLIEATLPDLSDDLKSLHGTLHSMTRSLMGSLDSFDTNSASKLKRSRHHDDQGPDLLWKELQETQLALEPRWKAVMNRMHARVNFGSEAAKSRLKVFNTDLWAHVDDVLRQPSKQIEKSRMPFHETERVGLEDVKKKLEKLDYKEATNEGDESNDDDNDNDNDNEQAEKDDIEKQRHELLDLYSLHEEKEFDMGDFADKKAKKIRVKKRKVYDLEVYDDRQFYSMLLKVGCVDCFFQSLFYKCLFDRPLSTHILTHQVSLHRCVQMIWKP
jgi:hypothetical protein